MNESFCAGSRTSSSALAGSPWYDTPSLSTSSSRNTGFLLPACFMPAMMRPGSAPMYVRRWPRMSASSRAPPSEMRTYLRPIARAIDFAIDVLPTPGGPENSRMRPFVLGLPFGELVDREELEHAILHVAEAVVILVEDLRGLARRRGARRCACPTAAPRSSRGTCGSPATPSTRGRRASGATTRGRLPCAPRRAAAASSSFALSSSSASSLRLVALAELLLDRAAAARAGRPRAGARRAPP